MNSLKLIYFSGCPEAALAKKALIKAGITAVEEILQDNLPEGSLYRKYSSPTILADEEVVYGIETTDSKPGCTFDHCKFLNEEEFIQRLNKYL